MNSDIATSASRDNPSACFKASLNTRSLPSDNGTVWGTGGISHENRPMGFRPAFYDPTTNKVYLSRYADGSPAPCHLLDGLPEEVILKRDTNGHVAIVKSTLVAGFLCNGMFYNREQANRVLLSMAGSSLN